MRSATQLERQYIFGPVPSRRLGQSLGIDTIPLKTCNWNCVYCQLGRTIPLTNVRREYVPRQAILAELTQVLAAHQPGEIDWLTFVGSGEPTLHSSMGWLIREVKAVSAAAPGYNQPLPVAVITNGALLYLPEMRAELAAADAVLPSLDAGNPDLYRKINRPHPAVSFERLVEGLVAFRQVYTGKFWVEVMLVRDLNDTEQALSEIAAVLQKIQPDEVHINLPTRPPVETWVQPPDENGLLRARAILGDIAKVVHPAQGEFDLSGFDTVIDAIIGIITRHPMQAEELHHTLERWTPGQVQAALAELAGSGRAQVVERYGVRFWSAAPAHYPDETSHHKTPASIISLRDHQTDPKEEPMKLSARNVLKAKVIQVIKGAVNAEVLLELPGGEQLTAIITIASAEALELAAGKDAYAVIKASNVMIAVD